MLEARGVLSPDEIHKLSSKVRGTVKADEDGKASCHSDFVDADEAKTLQEEVSPA